MADQPMMPGLGEEEELPESIVFPELVWRNILNKLESHSDLWNLLEVFPDLKELINWTEVLFDQVLTLIFKELNKKGLLACRKTCKWWKKAVDNFLDNHPSQQPYDPSSFAKITGYRYRPLSFHKFNYTDIVGTKRVRHVRHDVQQLMERYSILPSFVGKSARFRVNHECNAPPPAYFFDELDQLLAPELQFGASIWYVDFTRDFGLDACPEYQHILQSLLGYLPNLKSLSITSYYGQAADGVRDSEFARLLEQQTTNYDLPDNPHLESLELTDSRVVKCYGSDVLISMAYFHHALISKYAPQLRKLTIGINLWRDEYGSQLKNLTELSLDLGSFRGIDDPHALARSLFASLDASNLEKLSVKILTIDWLDDILGAIQNRNIKMLAMHTNGFDGCVVICSKPIISSVKALALGAQVHYERKPPLYILECFPELEYLEIQYGVNVVEDLTDNDSDYEDSEESEDDDGHESEEDAVPVEGLHQPTRRITAEFRPPGGSDEEECVVWELFPKLKVFVQDAKFYVRKMYERHD